MDCVLFSMHREQRSDPGAVYKTCEVVPEDETCAGQGRQNGGAGDRRHRKPFLRNTDDGWPGVPVTEEALWSHQLR